ncbi:molybdopterin synthase catalytic subunit [Helicobacter sp. 23-1048]
MEFLTLYQGALCVGEIYTQWENYAMAQNCGALCVFEGLVREEKSQEDLQNTHKNLENDLVEGLSFDVYEPLLQKWFNKWQGIAKQQEATLLMAHSTGDVPKGRSSFMCAVISSKRKAALGLYENFIEDFKANAPIWKYDIIKGERVFALSKSQKIAGSGILS